MGDYEVKMADGVVVDVNHPRQAPEAALEYILQSLQDEGMLLNVRFAVTPLSDDGIHIGTPTYIVVDGLVEEVK
jgi:hypothetical protein